MSGLRQFARILGLVLLLFGAFLSFFGIAGLALGALAMILGGALFAHSFLPEND